MKGTTARLVVILMALACPCAARADGYPSRPITWVLPFPAGGNVDTNARVVAKAVGDILRQPVIIENKGGAGGLIGTEYVVRAKPDGYTIGYGTVGTIAINPALLKIFRSIR